MCIYENAYLHGTVGADLGFQCSLFLVMVVVRLEVKLRNSDGGRGVCEFVRAALACVAELVCVCVCVCVFVCSRACVCVYACKYTFCVCGWMGGLGRG